MSVLNWSYQSENTMTFWPDNFISWISWTRRNDATYGLIPRTQPVSAVHTKDISGSECSLDKLVWRHSLFMHLNLQAYGSPMVMTVQPSWSGKSKEYSQDETPTWMMSWFSNWTETGTGLKTSNLWIRSSGSKSHPSCRMQDNEPGTLREGNQADPPS